MRSVNTTSGLGQTKSDLAVAALAALGTCVLLFSACEEHGGATVPEASSGTMAYPTSTGTDWTHAGETGQSSGVACLDVDTEHVDFGTLPVGDSRFATVILTSCGTADVTVSQVGVDGDVNGFHVDCSLLVAGECPSSAAPLILPPDAQATIRLYFEPETTTHANSAEPLDVALEIVSDAEEAEVTEVHVEATAVPANCPVAILAAPEPGSIGPGDRIELSAAESFSPNGAIVGFTWFLVAPTGIETTLNAADDAAPASAPEIWLDATLAGDYAVTLGVTDETGVTSCLSEQVVIEVRPAGDLYAELVWEAAEGTSGLAGRDLDLHLLHPNASGPDRDHDGIADGWFDPEWDCFWFTPDPGWAEQLSQSVDGWSPEVVHVAEPADGAVYRLGVHYWDDHGNGPASARLKLWVYGELVSDISGLTLADGDLWEAARVHWPDGEVTLGASGGAFDVTADYPVPAHYTE